ncbi:MAG: hypothetical protein QXY73_02520 [Candidatus Bathyarchaeia archaeon]
MTRLEKAHALFGSTQILLWPSRGIILADKSMERLLRERFFQGCG